MIDDLSDGIAKNSRLVAEGLGQDNLLLTLDILGLPLTSLESVVNASLLLLGILLAGSLLVLQFFLELGDKLDVT
jgi:hypothetical protein